MSIALFGQCCIFNPHGLKCPTKAVVMPTSLDFGKDLNTLTVSIKNEGGGTLNWQASKNESWIRSLSHETGELKGNESTLMDVTVDRNEIPSGMHQGEIQINTNDGPIKVAVNIEKEAAPPPPQTLRIFFSSMYIRDDMEVGEGDWRINCKVNGTPVVWIPKKEAGTGESVPINKTFNTTPEMNRVEVFCKIHEKDGGEWEYVGEKTHVYTRSGNVWSSSTLGTKEFKISNDEGKVTLKYSISLR